MFDMVWMKRTLGVLFGYFSLMFVAFILIQDDMKAYPWTFLFQQNDFLSSMRMVMEFYPPFLAFHIIEILQNNPFNVESILPYLVGGILGGLITEDGRSGSFVGFLIGVVSLVVSLYLNTYDLSVAYSLSIWDAFFLSFPFTLFGSTLGALSSLTTGFFGGILGAFLGKVCGSGKIEGGLKGREAIPSPVLFDEEAPIICPYCGSVLPSDARYCPNCGKKIRK
ncbi:MAG: zinc ribbon domain-containing protein [Candidatus Odinarchaeota archaeon]|nr:zinc ribbon domain-containing protein [Candidatus Odinarchaeota archaeon]